MRRSLALVMLLLVVGSTTGAFAAMTGESVCEDCGEGDAGCCPTLCPQCVCIARGVAADVPGGDAVLPPPDGGAEVSAGEEVGAPESAEPREIFHVPIAAG